MNIMNQATNTFGAPKPLYSEDGVFFATILTFLSAELLRSFFAQTVKVTNVFFCC